MEKSMKKTKFFAQGMLLVFLLLPLFSGGLLAETQSESPQFFRDFKGGELHEAGRNGYLVSVRIPGDLLKNARKNR